MTKRFDKIIEDYFGIFFGTDRMVFIKTGNGGTILGYENKYLNIAYEINQSYGYTVIVSANPVEYSCDLELEMQYIINHVSAANEIFFVGVSNGALVGAQQGWKVPQIKRMILFNGPLMINLHKTINGINKNRNTNICMVYGSKDPSYKYTELLIANKMKNLKIIIVQNADHNFAGMENVFNQMIYNELLY